jgi:hypothetical protein
MTEEGNYKMSSRFDNKLKTVSVEALQDAIAKAIGELVGEKYECTISNLTFTDMLSASLQVSINKRVMSEWKTLSDEKPKNKK